MADSYIPARDADALAWMQTFSNGIGANPALYQVTAADATNIADAVADFEGAYALVTDPAQRTPVNTALKDQTRAAAEELCRQVREGRLVLPIPPGTHWRDAKPILLPKASEPVEPPKPLTLPCGAPLRPRPEQPAPSLAHHMAIVRSQSKHLRGLPPGKAAVITASGLRYVDRGDHLPDPQQLPPAKPKRPAKPHAKNDPKQVAFVRELRDRYLEQYNTTRMLPGELGKYDVSRAALAGTGAETMPAGLPFQGAQSAAALPAPRPQAA